MRSLPSIVSDRCGIADTPALFKSTSSVACFARKAFAQARTLAREARSSSSVSSIAAG